MNRFHVSCLLIAVLSEAYADPTEEQRSKLGPMSYTCQKETRAGELPDDSELAAQVTCIFKAFYLPEDSGEIIVNSMRNELYDFVEDLVNACVVELVNDCVVRKEKSPTNLDDNTFMGVPQFKGHLII